MVIDLKKYICDNNCMANQGRLWDAKLEVSSICTKLLTKHNDTDSSAAAFICCGLF